MIVVHKNIVASAYEFSCFVIQNIRMRLTGAALRIRKRGFYKTKPLDRVIYGSDKTGKHLQPPRVAPVAPNAHFSRSGALEEAYNRPSVTNFSAINRFLRLLDSKGS